MVKLPAKKRLLFASLAACLVLTVAGCSQLVFSQGPVSVKPQEVISETDTLVINMKIPVISGIKDEELQRRINAELENAALRDREEITQLSRVAEKLADTTYELNWDYYVSYNKNGILSLTTTNCQYTGGAHGMTVQQSYNYDLNKGQKMSLASVFEPGADYQKVINNEIKKQMTAHPENYFTGDTGFQTIADNQDYYLQDKNLVVFFGLYEIAPYSSGIPEFSIPFARFAGGVRAEILE